MVSQRALEKAQAAYPESRLVAGASTVMKIDTQWKHCIEVLEAVRVIEIAVALFMDS